MNSENEMAKYRVCLLMKIPQGSFFSQSESFAKKSTGQLCSSTNLLTEVKLSMDDERSSSASIRRLRKDTTEKWIRKHGADQTIRSDYQCSR